MKQLSGYNQSNHTSHYPSPKNCSSKKQEIQQSKDCMSKLAPNTLHKILIVGELKTGKSSLIKIIHLYESLLEERE